MSDVNGPSVTDVTEESDTRQRIVDTAIGIITIGGESTLRMRDVAERVGIREPSIYHFFANREQLIEAAQAECWRRDQTEMVALFADLIGSARTRDEFVDTVATVLRRVFAPDRWAHRSTRIAVLGSAQSRPSLAAVIAESQQQVQEALAAVVRRAQDNGWVRGDLDARMFAAWVLGMVNGRVLVEMAPDAADFAAWDRIAIDAVTAVLTATTD